MTNSNSYLTIEEVSDRLHISVGTARNRLSRREPMPPSVTVGRRRLFPSAELEHWLMAKLVSNDDGFESDLNPFRNKEDAADE